jgi:prepilin peptidase CpaA
MLAGIGLNLLCHGWQGLQSSLLGLFAGLGLLFLFYVAGGMGAGDVKMLGAAGTFLGPRLVFFAFIWMAVAGGILAIFLMVWKKAGRRTLGNLKDLILSWILRIPPREANLTLQNPSLIKLPYGVPIAIGAILAAWLRWIPGA